MTLSLITDEIDIYVDPVTGDIPATGNLRMTTGLEAVKQGALIRLRMFAGEWFLNLLQGVPYFERVDGTVTSAQALLGQKFDQGKAVRAFRDQLLGNPEQSISGVPGIIELLLLEVTFSGTTRTLTVRWQARTQFGDTGISTLPVEV